jgi:hypothetical protein
MPTKQCDIRRFFGSNERSSPDLNDTLWCAIFVIQAFESDFIFKNIESSSLLFSFEHYNFYLFSYPSLWQYHIMHKYPKCDVFKYVTPCLYHTFWWNGWCDIIEVRVQWQHDSQLYLFLV